MRSKTLLASLLLLTLGGLHGCGGGGGGSDSDSSAAAGDTLVTAAEPETGILLDGVVSGVDYRTATQQGVTNARGEFRYMDGEMVTFSIGATVIGTARGAPMLTPVELTASGAPTDRASATGTHTSQLAPVSPWAQPDCNPDKKI